MTFRQRFNLTGKSIIFMASAIAIGLISATCAGGNLRAQERPANDRMEVQTAIRPAPQEALDRYAKLNAVAQPSVRAWVEAQARLELQRPTVDTASLNAAIKSRFGGAEAAEARTSLPTGIPPGADVEALAFMVLMQATNDQNQDLQEIMNEVQAQTKAKQALRTLINLVDRDVAANANQQAKETCATAECRSIAQQLVQVEDLTSQAKHPVHFNVSSPPTYGQLRQIQTTAKESLDSMSDVDQAMQMKLQMEQSQYSQIMEALSNIMKKMNDTSSNIIQNLK